MDAFRIAVCVAGSSLWAEVPRTPAELFQPEKVWSIHLRFSADQWEAIEPKGGEPFGQRPGGPGPMRMGPAAMFVPAFLKADRNGDGALSEAEFQALGAGWFGAWSKGAASIDGATLRAGLAATFPPPQFGPGGGPGGPGRGPGFLGAEGGRNGLSAAQGIVFPQVHADVEFEGTIYLDAAVRYKGNSTFMMARNSLKRSFKIDVNKFNKEQTVAGLTTINLHNNLFDPAWMNEALSYRLYRDAGVAGSRTSYARVYVSAPGKFEKKYFGLYSIVEDIDERFAQHNFQTGKGAIFKPSTRDLFGYLGPDWAKYNQIYDPKGKPSAAQTNRVIAFAKLQKEATDAEYAEQLGNYLDIDQFAAYMASTVMLSTMDSILAMGQNFYIHLHPDTNKFQFIPWDMDSSFGQFGMAGNTVGLSIDKPWQGQNRFLERVFSVPAFRNRYKEKIEFIQSKLFAAGRVESQVDQLAGAIRAAVAEESEAKLEKLNKAVNGESVSPEFGAGPRPPMMSGAKPIKGFVPARREAVAAQLAGKAAPAPEQNRMFGGPPGGFNPAMMLERGLMKALDADGDNSLTAAELSAGFTKLFQSWDTAKSGFLTREQLTAGIEKDLAAMPPRP